MSRGGFLAESIRPGGKLSGVRFLATEVRRNHVRNATTDQPPIWTLIEFEVDDADADALANAFAEALDEPGWYGDFERARRRLPAARVPYRRGDEVARAEAVEYGRSLRIPDAQLDWGE